MQRMLGFVLIFFASFAVFAQDTEPEDPGIVLPPVLLEIEDLQVEDVNAALPADEDQLRPEVSIPLPEAEELYVPDFVFDIPFPDQVGVSNEVSDATFTQYLEQTRSPIFSDGRIGIGAPIYVLGDLSLYKLGDEPRFRLRFFHEKLDGYGFRQTGSGFYHSDDLLEGVISFGNDTTGFEVSAGIQESANGLQRGINGLSAEYESVNHRDANANAELTQQFTPNFGFTGVLDVSYGSQILTAETPLIASELAISPGVQLGYNSGALDLSLAGEYEFISTTGGTAMTDHRIQALIGASYLLPTDIRLSFDGGIYWSSRDALLPNVTIGADGRIGTIVNFNTIAGYQVRPQRLQQRWLDAPLLAFAGPLSPEYGWSWSGTIQIRPVSSFIITADMNFDLMDNVLDPAVAPDAVTGLYSHTTRSLIALNTLLSFEWDITSILGIDLSWQGAFIDRTRHQPVQIARLTFDAEDPAERFGFLLEMEVEFAPDITIPTIGLGGYYRINDSVQFQLDVRDILSPMLDPGRYNWEPYIRPGLHAMLLTKISL